MVAQATSSPLSLFLLRLGTSFFKPGFFINDCASSQLSSIRDRWSKHHLYHFQRRFYVRKLIQLILAKANPTFWKLRLIITAFFYCIANWAGPIAHQRVFKPVLFITKDKLHFIKPRLCNFFMKIALICLAITIGLKCLCYADTWLFMREQPGAFNLQFGTTYLSGQVADVNFLNSTTPFQHFRSLCPLQHTF